MAQIAPQLHERTASHDRVLEWETPAKERGIGQSANCAGGMFTGEITLGSQLSEFASDLEPTVVLARESGTYDGGGKCSQGCDE